MSRDTFETWFKCLCSVVFLKPPASASLIHLWCKSESALFERPVGYNKITHDLLNRQVNRFKKLRATLHDLYCWQLRAEVRRCIEERANVC